jgi:preprotein translocase subunit YajC
MTSVLPTAALALVLQAPGGNITGMLVMYGAIFAIFYFVLIRPQQKQRKAHDAMVKALKKGDQIVTAGGIVGEVVHIAASSEAGADDAITIKSGESRLVIERGRIARVGTAKAAS